MKYSKKSSFGGYGRYRSGYLGKRRDYMEPYRHPSKPPDDYDRKIRRDLERVDTSGLSGRFEPTSYRIEMQRNRDLSQKEVDELTQQILDRAIEDFKKDRQAEVVPENIYETMQDAAKEIGERFWLVNNDPDDKTKLVDFVSELLPEKNESNQEKEIDRNYDSIAEFEDMAQKADEGSKLVNDGLPTEAASETETKPAIDNLSTELFETQDWLGVPKKKTLSDESEYDAI